MSQRKYDSEHTSLHAMSSNASSGSAAIEPLDALERFDTVNAQRMAAICNYREKSSSTSAGMALLGSSLEIVVADVVPSTIRSRPGHYLRISLSTGNEPSSWGSSICTGCCMSSPSQRSDRQASDSASEALSVGSLPISAGSFTAQPVVAAWTFEQLDPLLLR